MDSNIQQIITALGQYKQTDKGAFEKWMNYYKQYYPGVFKQIKHLNKNKRSINGKGVALFSSLIGLAALGIYLVVIGKKFL